MFAGELVLVLVGSGGGEVGPGPNMDWLRGGLNPVASITQS